jgi:hypothetical protein
MSAAGETIREIMAIADCPASKRSLSESGLALNSCLAS